MKQILHYLTLAALGATSGYTLPMQQMMGLLDFSTIAETGKQSFGKYALAATAGAALYGCYTACTSTAQQPEPIKEQDDKEIASIEEQICYATKKRPAIEQLKKEKSFLINTQFLHESNKDSQWYNSKESNGGLVITKKQKTKGASTNNYQYTVSLSQDIRDTCMQLIEHTYSVPLTTERIRQSINTRIVFSKNNNYPETLITAIVSEIERLRLGKNDKSIEFLNQELSAARKRLSNENAANLRQYYYKQYKSPCLKGAITGGLAYAAYSRYPRATVAFAALHMICSAYYMKHTAQNNQG